MTTSTKFKSTTVTLNAHGQDLNTVNKLVASILNRAGCGMCGRLAVLRVDFLGDPNPEFAGLGAISVHNEAF